MKKRQYLQALMLKRLLLLKHLGYDYTPTVQAAPKPSHSEISRFDDLEILRRQIANCHLCELAKIRSRVVLPKGAQQATVMFIGAFPGLGEDSSGQPFTGRSGEMLEKMIRNVLELTPEECYLTYLLKCLPKKAKEIDAFIDMCGCYLSDEIRLVSPRLIVSLGVEPYRYLFEDMRPIEELRQLTFRYQNIPLVVTYDPAYLLRNPTKKIEALDDLKFIKQVLS